MVFFLYKICNAKNGNFLITRHSRSAESVGVCWQHRWETNHGQMGGGKARARAIGRHSARGVVLRVCVWFPFVCERGDWRGRSRHRERYILRLEKAALKFRLQSALATRVATRDSFSFIRNNSLQKKKKNPPSDFLIVDCREIIKNWKKIPLRINK